MRNIILLFLSLVSTTTFAAEQLFTEQPSVTPQLAQSGKWPVGVRTVELVNPDQLSTTDFSSKAARPLTVEVWYPSDIVGNSVTDNNAPAPAIYEDVTRSRKAFSVQGKAYRGASLADVKEHFELVVISHGYTGYRSQLFYLGEHLASHGYVVAAIDHTDSTNAEIDHNDNPGAGFVSTLYNRARDQQFVLESLIDDSAFSNSLNAESAAIIGYSMGGYGALNTAGGCYEFTSERLQTMQFPEPMAKQLAPLFSSCNAGRDKPDPRWKAMIAFAPWGGVQNVHKLADVQVASLIIAGEQDDISGYQTGVKSLYEQLGADEKYMLVYENARHNIAGHPAPKVAYENDLDLGHYYEPSWGSESLTRINEHFSLAFLNCHLKGESKACAMLPVTERATQTKGADDKLSAPWPGFADRWATGMRFLRNRQP